MGFLCRDNRNQPKDSSDIVYEGNLSSCFFLRKRERDREMILFFILKRMRTKVNKIVYLESVDISLNVSLINK